MANYIIEIPIIHETFVTDNEEAGKAIEAICHPSCDDEFTVSDYYDLTPEAKAVLDKVGNDLIVDVVGTSSPEGDREFNQRLSEKRAAVVADYLTKRGVKVKSWVGKGVQIGLSTNRLAIVTVAQ